MGLDNYSAYTGILGKYGVPILMDLDFGHLPPMMPLVCGSLAKVRAGAGSFSIEMKLV